MNHHFIRSNEFRHGFSAAERMVYPLLIALSWDIKCQLIESLDFVQDNRHPFSNTSI
jgi:hypothetical protein